MTVETDSQSPSADTSEPMEADSQSASVSGPWLVPLLRGTRETVAKWVDEHSGIAATGRWVGPGFMAFAGLIASSPASVPTFLVGVSMLAVSEVGTGLRGRVLRDRDGVIESKTGEIDRLTAEWQDEQAKAAQQETVIKAASRAIQNYATAVLRRIAQEHNSSFDADCRASLYLVEGKEMKIVARFSQNTDWHSIGDATITKSFSRQDGLIGIAMQTGERQEHNYSGFKGSYLNWHRRKCNLVASEPRMKSKQYDVVPLRDPDTKNVVGVVSLETTDTQDARLKALGDVLTDVHGFHSALLRDVIKMHSSLQTPPMIETGDSDE